MHRTRPARTADSQRGSVEGNAVEGDTWGKRQEGWGALAAQSKASVQGGADSSAGQGSRGGAHHKHAVHGCDAGRVKA